MEEGEQGEMRNARHTHTHTHCCTMPLPLPDMRLEDAGSGKAHAHTHGHGHTHTPHTTPLCRVLDLGSGSGRDCYVCASLVGERGSVIGLDMTRAQLDVAEKYAEGVGGGVRAGGEEKGGRGEKGACVGEGDARALN